MKKYNLSKIMKRAHEIRRQDKRNVFSLCLKMAWKEAKAEVQGSEMKGSPKQIAWAEDIKKNVLITIAEVIELIETDSNFDATNKMMVDILNQWKEWEKFAKREVKSWVLIDNFCEINKIYDLEGRMRYVRVNARSMNRVGLWS